MRVLIHSLAHPVISQNACVQTQTDRRLSGNPPGPLLSATPSVPSLHHRVLHPQERTRKPSPNNSPRTSASSTKHSL